MMVFLNQASVAAGSTDQITIQDQAVTIQVSRWILLDLLILR